MKVEHAYKHTSFHVACQGEVCEGEEEYNRNKHKKNRHSCSLCENDYKRLTLLAASLVAWTFSSSPAQLPLITLIASRTNLEMRAMLSWPIKHRKASSMKMHSMLKMVLMLRCGLSSIGLAPGLLQRKLLTVIDG